MTATAWIFIDDATGDINTILGNKMSGCGSDALGFALYINEWKKSDGKLWLEWGDGATGCHKVADAFPLSGLGGWLLSCSVVQLVFD